LRCLERSAMKRGSNALEGGSPGGDNMMSVVQRFATISLGTPLQYPDQTYALQLGRFATKSVLGSHVTRVLAGTGTEADPGLSSLPLSEAVRNAAAAGQARRITRQNCGPTTKEVKQPPVARNAREWHRLRASVEITPLLKEEVFDDTSRFAPLSAVLNNTRQTNTGTQLLYPHVRYLPNAHTRNIFWQPVRRLPNAHKEEVTTMVAG
jgi:hypothetical protein